MREHRLGDVRSTVVSGPREAAFRALGSAAAADIRTVLAGLPSWPVAGRVRRADGAGRGGQVGSPSATVVEKAGDETAVTIVASGLSWHTNHFRRLPPHRDAASEESLDRAEVCAHLAPVAPDAKWLVSALTGEVYRSATGGDPLMTLSTVVTDLADGAVTVVPRGGAPLRARVADLASGNVSAVG